MLKSESWQHVLICDDPNLNAENIVVNKLQNLITKCTTKQKVKCNQKCNEPWISNSLITSIRYRNELKKDSVTNPNNIFAAKKYNI